MSNLAHIQCSTTSDEKVKVAINRPNFLPWLGFMAILDSVDVFIVLDEILSSTRNFLTRNQIKDKQGKAQWITQSKHKASIHTRVCDLELKASNWREKLVNQITDYYRKAPYFSKYADDIFTLINNNESNLLTYNVSMLKSLCNYLGINTKFYLASEILEKEHENAQDRMIDLCQKVKASGYYNPKDGVEKGLYQVDKFNKCGLDLYKHIYQHPEYPQINGEFVPYMSVIDLLFNCGDDSLNILRSGNGWEKQ